MRFVIVISGWARLGICAVDCVFDQNKKAAGQVAASVQTGSRIEPERQLCLWRPPLDAVFGGPKACGLPSRNRASLKKRQILQ
ncbi:hypothetical protein EJ066_09920 [Mesorhizobium sp. M9A.F.Ca.ET.002.03.1.2]|uniref:hypothetical protein n=1 Tax=Mesorhizobium sp. M9A.F.Ca.ET.002.03.1.2 TaxID=2493668 RepID=UPI000F76124B|nr:hypothetical protein [Mesorhizobium sp. M9A.F.Ca.ET.002.03.1.2]AZN97577.1 hypothetical protein EJ066_09920 [Mesorhizobium sp. M9A.F.Ca.ET.002.03.1.2]